MNGNGSSNEIECDLETSVNAIFSRPPQPPCTYNIQLKDPESTTLFKMLMHILISGAKKLYGNDITAEKMSKDQFYTLQRYFESFGYVIKYNYTYNDENEPLTINIWFDQYIPMTNCRGGMLR